MPRPAVASSRGTNWAIARCDRELVVGLHVRRRALRADRHSVEPLLERADRRRHPVRHGVEPEPAPRRDGRLVRRDHLERHERRTARLRVVRAGGDQRLRDALTPRAGADVHELDVRDTALGRLDAPDADRALVVLGDEDSAAADVVERVRPLLLPRLGLADRLGHLALELLPQLAQDRLVGLGGAADRHGTSEPIRRYCADRFSNGWSCAASSCTPTP